MDDNGVLAVNDWVTVGVSGSLLVMVRLHVLGPAEVGVKRTTRPRHESGLTTAGKGLLIKVKSEQFTEAAVTFRLH
jgi:hypothetical protein